MGIPRIKTSRARGPKTALVEGDKAIAQKAVAQFEDQLKVLRAMQDEWVKTYTEAAEARDDILRQEDLVVDAIKKAKPLVAKAEETIGNFTCQIKYSSVRYDNAQVTQIVAASSDRGKIMKDFLDSGIIKEITLIKDAAVAWFGRHPKYGDLFSPALRERKKMTPAITVPKL